LDLSKQTFDVGHLLAGKIPTGDDQCRFDFNVLEQKLKGLIAHRLGDENHVISVKCDSPEAPLQCRTFVVAKMAGNINAPPTIFRSYAVEGEARTKCTIWQAA